MLEWGAKGHMIALRGLRKIFSGSIVYWNCGCLAHQYCRTAAAFSDLNLTNLIDVESDYAIAANEACDVRLIERCDL